MPPSCLPPVSATLCLPTLIAAIRPLKGAARLLYDGVEETRQGRKVKIQDRGRALDSIAKHLGMFKGTVDPEETNPLEALVQSIMDNASTVPVASSAVPPAGPSPTHLGHEPLQDSEEIEP